MLIDMIGHVFSHCLLVRPKCILAVDGLGRRREWSTSFLFVMTMPMGSDGEESCRVAIYVKTYMCFLM